MIKISPKKTKKRLLELLKVMAWKPFLAFCIFFAVCLSVSLIIFLNFGTVFIGKGDSGQQTTMKSREVFKTANSEEVFDIWKNKEEEIKKINGTGYPDLFAN